MKTNTLYTQLRSFSLRKGKGQPRPFIYPAREWTICLIVSLCVAIVLFGQAAIDFKTQLAGNDTPEITPPRVPKYNPDEAATLIRYYEGKERMFTTLTASTFSAPAEGE